MTLATQSPAVPGFRLTSLLGEGGSGQVWAATREVDGRPFAVKVVAGDEDGRRQALRELALLGRISCDHLVRLHAALPLSETRLALVLDLVEGGTLGDVVAARRHLFPGEVVTVLVPVCRVLDHLHDASAVHADLSPANVLFMPDGRPMVGDLGSSWLAGECGRPVHATVGFVAPEVRDGDPPSPASDVYAVGALAWFCLTGSAPPRVQRPPLAELVRELPTALVGLVEACLDPDPAGRPTADVLARELFDACPATPVVLPTGADPAAQLTSRLRAEARAERAKEDSPEPALWRRRWVPRRNPAGARARGGLALWPAGPGARVVAAAAVAAAAAAVLVMADRGMLGQAAGAAQADSAVRLPQASATQAVKGLSSAAAGQTGTDAAPSAVDRQGAVRTTTAPAGQQGDAADRTPNGTGTGTGDAAAGGRTAVDDRNGARKQPRAVLQELVDTRAKALTWRDAQAVAAAHVPGTSASAADLSAVAQLTQLSARYEGLSMTVVRARWLSGNDRAARVAARVDTAAYHVRYDDGRVVAVPARHGPAMTVALGWSGGRWRIAAVER